MCHFSIDSWKHDTKWCQGTPRLLQLPSNLSTFSSSKIRRSLAEINGLSIHCHIATVGSDSKIITKVFNCGHSLSVVSVYSSSTLLELPCSFVPWWVMFLPHLVALMHTHLRWIGGLGHTAWVPKARRTKSRGLRAGIRGPEGPQTSILYIKDHETVCYRSGLTKSEL